MKNTDLTTKEDRTERGVFALVSLSVLIIVMLIAAISEGCSVSKENDPLLRAGTQDQKKAFLECSKNEGDRGCDSCYVLIYGKSSGF